MNNIFKSCMFIISFLPLWINILIINGISIFQNSDGILVAICNSVLILISVIFSFLYISFANKKINKKDNLIECKLISSYQEKSMASNYLLSYILPLFIFDFNTLLGVLQFLIYFVIILVLCVKNSYVYINILLEFLGYTTFNCKILEEGREKVVYVISNDDFNGYKNKDVNIYELDNPFYLHKVIFNNED